MNIELIFIVGHMGGLVYLVAISAEEISKIITILQGAYGWACVSRSYICGRDQQNHDDFADARQRASPLAASGIPITHLISQWKSARSY